MPKVFRHFIASVVCILIFTFTGTLTGFLDVLQGNPHADPQSSFVFTWSLNFIFVTGFTFVVLLPVTSLAEFLFTRHWSFPIYLHVPLLGLLLIVYLIPWSLLYGRAFLSVLVAGSIGLSLPLLTYWGVFHVLDRQWDA